MMGHGGDRTIKIHATTEPKTLKSRCNNYYV